jgi:DNA-directed RNA polymerase specialized sigma54-like protein
MALLQPKLSLKVSQRQILTPGLLQMVSVLALNKLELKEMIDAEMVENPVLEEIDESVPMLDEVAGRVERQEREERLDLHETAPSPSLKRATSLPSRISFPSRLLSPIIWSGSLGR